MKQQLLFFRMLQVFVIIFGLVSQSMAQTPGGVSTNLRVWFKANDGPNTTTEGGAVSSWADKGGLGFNIAQATAARQPKYHQKAMNFNPVVRFNLNTIGNVLANSIIPATTNPVSIVAMSICNRSTSGYNTIVSFGGGLDYPSDQIYNGTFRTYVDGTLPIFSDHPEPMALKPTITYSTHANLAGSAGVRRLGFNGLGNMQTPNITNGDFPAGGVSDQFSLGAERSDNLLEDFLGDIPEVIVYNKVLTNAELQKIQSYLAVKYGVTMDNLTDYHSSAGSIMWAKSTTYGNNVFGIAKDDGSSLDQRVSKSINTGTILTIATNNDFVSANNDASRTSLTNGQSLIVGDNGTNPSLYSTFTSNCVGVAGSVRLNTVWQASNVNTVGSVLFNVNLSGSGINDEPFMLIGNSAAFGDGTYRFVKGIINADGTATFAAKLNHGEFFTFGGVRAAGVCAKCYNGSGVIEWNKAPFWPIPTLTNTTVTKTIGGTGQTANIIFNDPQGVEYARRVRPIRYGKTLLLDRWDNFTPTGTVNGGAYTGVFTFDKASLVNFSIHAIDRWNINCKDIVEIKGYCGAKTISPKLGYTLPASQSSYVISGNIATGNKLWSGYFAKRGMLKVEFDTPVERIEIIWKTTKVGTPKRFQRIGISNMSFDCPDADPCLVNDDNVTFIKKISDNVSQKVTCENITFQYKFKNNTCVDKIVNINDVLPAGMQWITDGFDGGASGGTTNSYAGTTTLTASGISVPAGQGISVFATAKFTNTSAASYSNRATMTVNGGVAGTISSGCGNTNWTTIAGTPPPVPAITHTVNKTCYNKNEVLTYTVTLNNTSGAPITGAVFETALQDEFGMIDGSVSNTFGGTITLDEGATGYGGMENLEITGMTLPIGISTFTYQANSGVSDSTFVMYASVSADPNTDCATEAMQTATGITMSLCAACSAGTTAPIITQTTANNACPATTANLATMTNTGTAPSGTHLVWSTLKAPAALSDTLTNLNVGSGKYYALYVDKTNTCFSTTADSVTVTVAVCCTNPVITTQPSNVTLCTPGTATATVVATGTGLTYQWQSKPVGAASFGNAGEGGNGTATITLEAGSHPEYRCIIKSGTCEVISDIITLTKVANPVITTQPSNVTLCTPGTATATVVATGTGLTYQWQSKPVGAASFGNAGEGGNGTATITLEAGSHPEYRCIIKSGTCEVISSVITLTKVAKPATPVPTATTINNACPLTTANLTTLEPAAVAGQSYEWHTVASNPTASTLVANPSAVSSGSYYLYSKTTSGGCYSTTGSSAVVVTVTSCSGIPSLVAPPSQSANTNENKSGDAAAELAPSGGTPGYTYSNGSSDPLCVAPSGATALPASSNLIVNANGTYTYTAPSTPGTYYFCVKVCDNATPTPNCNVAVYKVVVVCSAGTTAPTLSATTKSNVCPATTANISTLVTSTCPVGSTIQWHNVNTGLSAANKVADPTAVAAGTYYPVCFDAAGACYGPTPSTGVTVTINSCSLNFTGGNVSGGTVTQNATPGQSKSGGAAADLVPTGGTPGYNYSNGSTDPACVAPSGATALPATSNLIVNTDGTYTYTAPTTAGTYYFCVKVCDSATPTPVCAIATYKVVVAAICAAGNTAPVPR